MCKAGFGSAPGARRSASEVRQQPRPFHLESNVIMAVHFFAFVEHSDSWHRAIAVFGPPAFVHRRWDVRAKLGGDFDPEVDVFVFAKGTDADEPSPYSFNDSEVA